MMHWWNLSKQTEYLDDVPTWGQRDYRLYPPLDMVILSTEEEVEEEVEVEEGESGFRKDKWIDLMDDLEEDMFKVIIIIQEHNNKLQQIDHNQLDKKMNWSLPTNVERRDRYREVSDITSVST